MAPPRKKQSRTPDEIQESGNIILDNTLENIRDKYQDIKIIKTSEENQKDRGVDFQIELVEKPYENTKDMFKLQVKATDDPVKTLKKTVNKGSISFQIDNRHVRYYQQEMPWAILFLLCDNSTKTIYWHAIQLDHSLEERLIESIANKNMSLQIFIDPKNVFGPDSFVDFVRDAEESKKLQFFRVSEENENTLTASGDFHVNRSKPLLEQLFTLLEYLFEEVNYLPMHLLSQYYPFKVSSEGQACFYLQFKLYVENEELVDMLDTFKVQSDASIKFTNPLFLEGVDDYEKKVVSILRKLSQNHVYAVIGKKSRKEVSTRYFTNGNCDCVSCCYNRLDIPETIKKLEKSNDKSFSDHMKTAYMHYAMGNYLKAVEEFENVGKQANKENKKTLFLITKFNLIRLGRLIRNNYYDKKNIERGNLLMDINMDRIIYSAKNRSHHRKLFNYIKEARFYSDSAYAIQTALIKLRSEYQSFVRGQSFNTNSYNELLNGFAQLNSFIGENWIVYDRLGEFILQIDEFTEGIFIALALRESGSNVISSFNDYHIQCLIFDGDHRVIWRYFNKYLFKSIAYNETSGRFYDLIGNLLKNNHLVNDAYKNYLKDDGSLRRNRYPEIFANCLCLASMIEMTNSQVEGITMGIMSCYEKADLPSPEAYVQINSFFSSKRNQLSDPLIEELICFFLNYNDIYVEKRLGIFTAELKSRKLYIKLSKKQLERLFDFALDKNQDEQNHFNVLTFFHPIVDSSTRKKIEKRIKEQLHIKFDAYQFYYAAITDSLPFLESEFMEQFIQAIYPDTNALSFRDTFYGPQDNGYPLFDMFFNLCFKFGVKPSHFTKMQMNGFGKYYDWLLDIDGFDYSKFKISWLGLNPVKFYLEELSKSAILRGEIENYLRNNRDLQVERLYFDIYNPENNGVEPDYE